MHSIIYDTKVTSNFMILALLELQILAMVRGMRSLNIMFIHLNKPLQQNLIQNRNVTYKAVCTCRSTISNSLCLQQSINEGLHFTWCLD